MWVKMKRSRLFFLHRRKELVFLFIIGVLCWRLAVPIPDLGLNHASSLGENAATISGINVSIEHIQTHNHDVTSELETKSDFDPLMCQSQLRYLSRSKSRKPLLLASYPGSGNTWTRHLIQSGSRILTGSVYNDRSIIQEFPAEGKRDTTVIVTKTHFPCAGCWNIKSGGPVSEAQSGDLKTASGSVYIIRSPFDAILAEFKRKVTGLNHTGDVTDTSIYKQQFWNDFVKFRVNSWINHVQFYLNHHVNGNIWRDKRGRKVLLLYFEHLKSPRTVRKMLKNMFEHIFQHHDLVPPSAISAQDAVTCSLYNQTGSYKRSSRGHINPYTEEQRQQVCSQLMSKRNTWHEQVWGSCDGRLQWER
mmetsp:Transcript_21422/g.27379  ORF Transcript_21422/g.27379 Transcript_21422/m.27379 type:complete len:361 (+) Transcript_21422:107-1189(+)